MTSIGNVPWLGLMIVALFAIGIACVTWALFALREIRLSMDVIQNKLKAIDAKVSELKPEEAESYE